MAFFCTDAVACTVEFDAAAVREYSLSLILMKPLLPMVLNHIELESLFISFYGVCNLIKCNG